MGNQHSELVENIHEALVKCKAHDALAPDGKRPETFSELDERLFATPSIALERRQAVADHMAETAVSALREAFQERYREYQRKYALP